MKVLAALLFFASVIIGQAKDPDTLVAMVKNEFDKIEDYEVDVVIKIDINFLKVPESKAKIFFKKPDKVRLKSEGFALLPKEGLNFSPSKLLEEEYTAIYAKQDTIDGRGVDVVKVIPSSDTSNVVLTSLWIDETEYVVRKVETTTKRSGTFSIDLSYDDITNFHLPSEVSFSFNVSDMQLPSSLTGDFESSEPKPNPKNKQLKGTVTISYSNYKVNQGLPNSIFEEEEADNKN
jgi:outer membrane lipoprotein-sorting protein